MSESNFKTDQNMELARERTFLASENTLMSWVRTSLTLIGFGIGIFEALERSGGTSTFRSSRLVGLCMVLLGVVALVFAIAERNNFRKQLAGERFIHKNRASIAVKVAYGLIVIGIIGFIQLVMKLRS